MAEVKITISAKDGTQQVFRAVEANVKSAFDGVSSAASDSSSKVSSAFGSLKSNWLAVTAAITAAAATIGTVVKGITDWAALSARVETLGVVINTVGSNAGYSTQQMETYAQGVKRMGITTQESLSSTARMAQAQIDLSKSSQLARIAQDAAVIGNINSSEALAALTHGIQSAQIEVLRTIGINVNFESSYAKLAAQLGKSTDALTEQEKVQARTNVVLEAGKNISGVYAASMDTVGKQALSLARYSEEARLKLGELFKPTYAALINLATSSLKSLNETLRELNESGTLQAWGEAGVTAIKLLAESAIPAAIVGVGSLGGYLVSTAAKVPGLAAQVVTLTREFTSLEAVMRSVGILATSSSLLSIGPMLSGAAIAGAAWLGYELGSMYNSTSAIDKQRTEAQAQATAENKEFLAARWRITQQQLEESGIKGMLSPNALFEAMQAGDIVKYTVKVGENVDIETGQIADVLETRFKNVREELQRTKEQIDATTKGFAEMGSTIDKMGGMSLKLGSSELSRQLPQNTLDLKAFTVEYQQLSDSMKANITLDRQISQLETITQAYEDYADTIDNVYSSQIYLQKEILYEAGLYETKQSNIAKQAANVAQTEIKYNEALLSNYQEYYEKLKSMQKTAYDQAVKYAQNLVAIEKSAAESRRSYQSMIYEVWNKANPAKNAQEEWARKAIQLDNEMAYALTLSGEQQQQALANIARAWTQMDTTISVVETKRKLQEASSLGLDTGASWQDVEETETIDMSETIMSRIQQIADISTAGYAQMTADAETNRQQSISAFNQITDSVKTVDSAISSVEKTLQSLDTELEKQRVLAIDTSGALSGLALVRDYLVEIINLKDQAGSLSSTSGASSLEFSFDRTPINSNAAGASSIPATGLSRLSRREAATPATGNRATAASLRPITISFGNIIINGADKDARKLAREIAPAVRDEIRRIEARK